MVTARGGQARGLAALGVSALALVAATASAALVAARLYIGPQLALVLAGAAAAAVLLTLLLRWLRSPVVLVVLGSLAGLGAVLVGLVTALRHRARIDGSLTTVLLDAVTNSGARLMTSPIPIEPAPDTVALPLTVTWLAGTGAALLLGRWPLAALAPPVVLLAGSLVFVGPNAPPAYHLVALLAVAAAAQLVMTRDGGATGPAVSGLPARTRRVEAGRRMAAGLAAVAVLGVLAVTVGPAAAALYRTQPYDPRALFVPPQQTSEALNPLGLLSAWATETELPLLEVTAGRPVRTSWVAMSRFDGITWLPDDEFRAAGSVLPKVEPAPLKSRSVTQRITVRSLGGSWLPAAEVPRTVKGLRASFDAGSRMLAAPDGLHEGLSYTVTSEVPVREPSYLIGAGLPAGKAYDRLLEVPQPLPEGFAELAEKATGQQGTPYQKALRLEKFLRTTYRFQPGAPSGHGYPNLAYFLTEPKAKGGGRGTSEQFATAFALLGRVVGLPTRVVVGFHAGKEGGKGQYLVSSGDAFAWAEVYLLGEGWVPFDPTPGREGAQPPPEENTPEAEAESEQKEQQLTKPDPSAPPGADNPTPVGKPKTADAGVPGWVLTVAALGGVLLVALLVLPGLRYRRSRSRLSRGSPSQRVVGAWAEVRESLRLAGHRPALSTAAQELASVHSGDGLPELRGLAGRVNAIGFGPGAAVGEPDAQAAAQDASAYVRALRRRQPAVRRALWWLDPRPLFWRS